jgi:biotin synthase-like enzyme
VKAMSRAQIEVIAANEKVSICIISRETLPEAKKEFREAHSIRKDRLKLRLTFTTVLTIRTQSWNACSYCSQCKHLQERGGEAK